MRENTVTPKRILDIGWDYARSRTLATGVELGVFTHIAKGMRTAVQISRAAKSSPRGMEMLLNALVGLRLLIKGRKGNYRLARDAEAFLIQGRPSYLGDMSLHTAQLSDTWRYLTEAVKMGRPHMCVDEGQTADQFFPDLVKALFAVNYPAAKYAASYLKRMNNNISSILDVAAGSGVWGIAFVQEFPEARLTALDFPSLIKIARANFNRFKIAKRCNYLAGDLRAIDFGAGRYDLIILGHICHSEGETNTKRLLKKSYRALREGGNLLIADFVPNDKRTGPDIPLLFALNMLLNTNEGDVFTAKQYQNWLAAAGFGRVRLLREAPSQSPLIIAMKE